MEPAEVDLTGLGRVFVMVEESAANDVGDPALFSDPTRDGATTGLAADSGGVHPRHGRDVSPQPGDHPGVDAVGLLLTPTVTLPPQPLDTFLADTERVAEDDLAYIPFTYPFNISGQPAISLPLG